MRYVILLFSVVFLWSCGSKTTVILLPEDTGQTGKIIVKNKVSETLLDKPYTYVDVKSENSILKAQVIGKEDVERSFNDLLKAEPPKPVHFIIPCRPLLRKPKA